MEKKFKLGFPARIAICVVVVFLLFSIVRAELSLKELKDTHDALAAQVEKYEFSVEELKEKLAQPLDEKTIKRFAREKLNLRDPGDILFVSDLPE